MAKERERKTARILYVEQGKTAKDIAGLVNVAEKTISAWVNKYAWKAARTSEYTNKSRRVDNIKQIIASIANDKIQLQRELSGLLHKHGKIEEDVKYLQDEIKENSGNTKKITELKKQLSDLHNNSPELNEIENIRKNLARLDDGAAKWTKTLKTIDKDSQISLSTYLYVMQKVFRALQNYDTKLFMKTLDFQEQHVNEISIEIG